MVNTSVVHVRQVLFKGIKWEKRYKSIILVVGSFCFVKTVKTRLFSTINKFENKKTGLKFQVNSFVKTRADNSGYTNHRVTCLVVMGFPFDNEQVHELSTSDSSQSSNPSSSSTHQHVVDMGLFLKE